MTQFVKEILPISPDEQKNYKLHFATFNTKRKGNEYDINEEPLSYFLRSEKDWKEKWQGYRPTRNDFNRKYIFSLARFPNEGDMWLFGGVYEVCADRGTHYDVELTEQGEEFIGRLKIYFPYYSDKKTQPRPKLETYYDELQVHEVLSQRLT